MSLVRKAWKTLASKIPDGANRGLNTEPHQDISTIVKISVDELHAIVHHSRKLTSMIDTACKLSQWSKKVAPPKQQHHNQPQAVL